LNFVLDARTVTDHFPGIGRYVFNLARAMAPLLEPDEQLILLYDPTRTSPWNLASLADSQTRLVEMPISPFSLRQQWLLPRLLRSLRADLYHSPYYLMPYRPGIPTLLTIYDLIPWRYPRYFSTRTRLVYRYATALALRAAARVTTISDASRRDLLAFYQLLPQSVTTIQLAADPLFRPVAPQDVSSLRFRLGLADDYLLYVGSNKPHKNLIRLVEAWAIVNRKSEIVNQKLVIAGVWDARYPQAKIRVEELGLRESIRFLGPVAEADLPALYGGATAFVFPSEYEGFGLPVLEAMACGVPVACANVSSLPEVAGQAALYFDPFDVVEIADTLDRLLCTPDLQAKLRQQSLARAAQFSWERAAHETLQLYRAVL
jgi:glycosyltransferase involved in cell wall biosynthesis